MIDHLAKAAQCAAEEEGWLSASLHRSLDGMRVVNYAQSASLEAAQAVIAMLRDSDLVEHSRVVMEKPFGHDLASAVQLNDFVNPAGLQAMGDNLYIPTTDDSSPNSSGEPQTGTPGQGGMGTLTQGYLEVSNVNLIDEMVNLVVAQRAYEVNSKVVQAADQLLNISNNLYR